MEYVEIGGDFSPDGREWIVYAVQREDESGEALADIYIFEAVKRNMVMAVFGCRFTQLRRGVLAQILKDVNYPGTAQAEIWMPKIQTIEKNSLPTTGLPSTLTSKSSSKRDELLQILSNITDFPLQEVGAASTLEELGIDSLMATEVISDIRTSLNLSIDLTAFFSGEGAINTPRYSDIDDDVGSGPQSKIKNSAPKLPEIVEGPTLTSVISDFEDTRLGYDRLAVGAKAVGFWSEAYPHQARLVLAHVVEAFAELGCDLKRLQPGDTIPQVEALDKHKQFMRQLHRVLEDGKLISPRGQGFVRTDSPVDMTSAHIIHQQIIDLYPQHSNDTNRRVPAWGLLGRQGRWSAGDIWRQESKEDPGIRIRILAATPHGHEVYTYGPQSALKGPIDAIKSLDPCGYFSISPEPLPMEMVAKDCVDPSLGARVKLYIQTKSNSFPSMENVVTYGAKRTDEATHKMLQVLHRN
ncbi:hypothetical protein SUNI508_09062 [Seiridium unicorne]|uniref:Carrier domain-containing protein n=1 Tax=Seiridium unicorne TaxID=138068 RepID=A0ABR2URH2_9PEZI